MPTQFRDIRPSIEGNPSLRIPQQEGFLRIRDHFAGTAPEREVAIVLPVGCGKSGLICLAPFAVRATRVLVVAPQVRVAGQLHEQFDPTAGPKFFYKERGVIPTSPFPEPVEIRGKSANRGDLDNADVVVTNIDQLQGDRNRWLIQLPRDYFDLILFDEGHHAVAQSWETLRSAFPNARIVNFSATPLRADGQLMPGRVIYSYPVREAIERGYVKRLKALVLNPASLRYVQGEGGAEVEVSLDEVRRLGETDAEFRRSIVSSRETLTTIVDASIRELRRIRTASGDIRHKIIAAVLNFQHCHQVVQAFRERGLRADYVHTRDGAHSEQVLAKLERHELDVVVQVRKLGEGFDHPFLSVAAVCSIFSNLSPFVQFVGRVMRVIPGTDPAGPNNLGTVVFHAGGNIAQRWDDFREFSDADQAFFNQLLPVEGLDFSNRNEIELDPVVLRPASQLEVRGQSGVVVEEIPLLENEAAMQHIRALREQGVTLEQIREVYDHEQVPTTLVRQRQAARAALNDEIKRMAGEILAKRGLSHEGQHLDKQRLGRTNFQVVKARIDKLVRDRVADKERSEFSAAELKQAQEVLPAIQAAVAAEIA
jgi:superfamily II DNA or RNA helicase